MGAKLSGLGRALYNPKRREFLGRDGAGWGKLGVFYFFFYLGLAGFFCAMLAIFMALTPRDQPRYVLDDSRMRTRSNPLAPGLGFRPQPEVDKNIIIVKKHAPRNEINQYARSLDQYLQVFYWKNDRPERREQDDDNENDNNDRAAPIQKFVISNPGECRNDTQYGYAIGRPCVLVKMNKIVGFEPEPGAPHHEKEAYKAACGGITDATAVHCYGEYPADVDNVGPINYYSEKGQNFQCGRLESKWFPYQGKYDRQDRYQAPYVWVQFADPKPNVLINVLCRIYGRNIDFDKKAGRALTRFQIYVDAPPVSGPTRRSREI